MASKILTSSFRLSKTASSPILSQSTRSFRASTRQLEAAAGVMPIRKPIGAFRGGLFGFLAGSTATSAAVYYYILDEYKVSNELLTEDIYALQAAVQRIHTYVSSLEEKVEGMQKKKS